MSAQSRRQLLQVVMPILRRRPARSRWKLSQNQSRDVPLAEAVSSYVDTVLAHRRDEATMIDPPTGTLTLPIAIVDEDDWRSKV